MVKSQRWRSQRMEGYWPPTSDDHTALVWELTRALQDGETIREAALPGLKASDTDDDADSFLQLAIAETLDNRNTRR